MDDCSKPEQITLKNWWKWNMAATHHTTLGFCLKQGDNKGINNCLCATEIGSEERWWSNYKAILWCDNCFFLGYRYIFFGSKVIYKSVTVQKEKDMASDSNLEVTEWKDLFNQTIRALCTQMTPIKANRWRWLTEDWKAKNVCLYYLQIHTVMWKTDYLLSIYIKCLKWETLGQGHVYL